MSSIIQLRELYAKNSKHSNYQILSEKLAEILGEDQIDVQSRYERERFNYFLKNVEVKGKSILDIGGNSGYFTFESIARGAKKVQHYEGNKVHSEFVGIAAEVLGYIDNIEISSGYYSFAAGQKKQYDLVFLLNVLHHLGDDYGNNSLSITAAKKQMATQLNNMASTTNQIIFQLGFNWKGDRDMCLFDNGTKGELIDYVKKSVDGFWDIEKVGVAVRKDGEIVYVDLDDGNIQRDDSMGEFLNRPIFIMKAK